jgi:hypothetical protein
METIDSKYNCLEQDFEEDYIKSMKVYVKVSEKYTPKPEEWTQFTEYYEEKHFEVEVKPRRQTDLSSLKNSALEIAEGFAVVDDAAVNDNEDNEEMENEEEEEEVTKSPKTKSKVYYLNLEKQVKYKVFKNFNVPEYAVDSSLQVDYDTNSKYQTIVNPESTFYGEVIVHYNPHDGIILSDYGKLPSMRPITYPEQVLQNVKFDNEPKASRLESNVFTYAEKNLLTDTDLTNFILKVKQLNGFGMLKVLPSTYAEYKDYAANKIRIAKLPLKELNGDTLPIMKKIAQKEREYRRDKLINITPADVELDKLKLNIILDNEQFSECLDIHDYITLDDYDFPHLIKHFYNDAFDVLNIQCYINYMIKNLNIDNNNESGFVLLMTNKFLFMAPLVKPYIIDNNNIPIFAEPYFYAGIFTLPLIEAEWPETLKGKYINYNLSDVLRISSNNA